MALERIKIDDDLVLRAAATDDAEQVARLNELVHAEPPENKPAVGIAQWTRDLFAGVNRAVGPSDFTVVADTSTGKIVSSICLMSQTWNIGGIDTPMGMPEIVGTHPDYRRRGLVRRQFELMHRWSEDRGQLFSTVMGIPFYYRQFGYEYAIDAWGGSTTTPSLLAQVSSKKGGAPPFTARDAERSDIRFIAATYRTNRDRAFITVNRDTRTFEDEMFVRSEESAVFYRTRIIERDDGPVGFYMYEVFRKNSVIGVISFEIDPSVNWLDATTSVLVDLWQLARRYPPEGKDQCEKIEFSFGRSHPAYQMFDTPFGAPRNSYAWYVRIPNVPTLVTHLTPLFEKRLAESVFRGWSGDLKISFFTDGIQMSFDAGKLKSVASTGIVERSQAAAHYPGLTFTKVLFGQHSFTYLRDIYPDCSAKDHAMATMQDILFGGPLTPAILPAN